MSAQGEKNQLIKPGETPAVSEKTESEISDEKDSVKEDEKADISISEDWPSLGAIQLKNVCFRHRENLPLVLKNVSLMIAPGSNVGVVGRTGAGKTSLFSAILRHSGPKIPKNSSFLTILATYKT